MRTRSRRFNLYFGLHVAVCLFGGVMFLFAPGVILDPWQVPADDPIITGLTFNAGANMLTIALLSGVLLRVEPARLRHGGAAALVIWNGLIVYGDLLIGRATGADMTSGMTLHGAWALWGLILLVAFRESAATVQSPAAAAA